VAYKKNIVRRGAVKSWEDKFSKVLKKHHGHFAKKIFHRLMKKTSTLKSSLKKRSKEYEVVFDISLEQIRSLFLKFYGKQCRYCPDVLVVSNIVCDHMYPLSLGGDSTPKNLTIICKRCNTRKGHLTDGEYKSLLKFLETRPDNMKRYVLRKLAKGDDFK
jgi:5-methylcytosine-specific restriction endonuclease McrA